MFIKIRLAKKQIKAKQKALQKQITKISTKTTSASSAPSLSLERLPADLIRQLRLLFNSAEDLLSFGMMSKRYYLITFDRDIVVRKIEENAVDDNDQKNDRSALFRLSGGKKKKKKDYNNINLNLNHNQELLNVYAQDCAYIKIPDRDYYKSSTLTVTRVLPNRTFHSDCKTYEFVQRKISEKLWQAISAALKLDSSANYKFLLVKEDHSVINKMIADEGLKCTLQGQRLCGQRIGRWKYFNVPQEQLGPRRASIAHPLKSLSQEQQPLKKEKSYYGVIMIKSDFSLSSGKISERRTYCRGEETEREAFREGYLHSRERYTTIYVPKESDSNKNEDKPSTPNNRETTLMPSRQDPKDIDTVSNNNNNNNNSDNHNNDFVKHLLRPAASFVKGGKHNDDNEGAKSRHIASLTHSQSSNIAVRKSTIREGWYESGVQSTYRIDTQNDLSVVNRTTEIARSWYENGIPDLDQHKFVTLKHDKTGRLINRKRTYDPGQGPPHITFDTRGEITLPSPSAHFPGRVEVDETWGNGNDHNITIRYRSQQSDTSSNPNSDVGPRRIFLERRRSISDSEDDEE